jgi:hypothetical protein
MLFKMKNSPESSKNSPELIKNSPESFKNSPESFKNSPDLYYNYLILLYILKSWCVFNNYIQIHRTRAHHARTPAQESLLLDFFLKTHQKTGFVNNINNISGEFLIFSKTHQNREI